METQTEAYNPERIASLENRLAEAEQLIEAIKAGEVDAFALRSENNVEVFTLQSGDYAYRVLVENVNEGAINITEKGLIVYCNKYFHELLGLSYDKVIGTSLRDFLSPESIATFNSLFTNALAGQSKGEINLIASNKNIPVYVSLTSLYPKLPTVGIIVTDLTEKKKNEKILEDKNKELERSNSELASFSYIASHDLQEPLRKIITFSKILQNKNKDSLCTEVKSYLDKIEGSSVRMQNLINDLLNYSRLQNEKLFVQTDLNQTVINVLNDFELFIHEKKAVIKSDELPVIDAIPLQMTQLFYNLISNALKFSREDVPPIITITSRTLSEKEIKKYPAFNLSISYVEIIFKDNGIGFEQQYSEQIFTIFQRLHAKETYSGTGIGLALCKKIIENHQGEIFTEAKENEGASFHIILPLKQSY